MVLSSAMMVTYTMEMVVILIATLRKATNVPMSELVKTFVLKLVAMELCLEISNVMMEI